MCIRDSAYTQAALAELMRTRGIDLANQSAAAKLATTNNTNNNSLINGALTNRDVYKRQVQHAGPTSADGFWMATMSLVNWVANVILPVFALTQLAAMALHMGGVVSEIYPGSTWIRKFIAAMGALLVSGMVRLAESMVTHAHGI